MAITKVQRNNKSGYAYRVRVDAGYDPATNKRRQVGKVVSTWKEARDLEADLLRQVKTGTVLIPDRATVAELMDEWLRTHESDVSANTIADYKNAINKRVLPAFGHVKVQKLSTAMIQAKINEWKEAGLSRRMIRDAVLRLDQALEYAIDQKIVHTNVAEKARLPKLHNRKSTEPGAGKRELQTWEPHEVAKFLQQAEAMPVLNRGGDTGKREPDSLWPLWPLLVLEGLRRGEALGLRWSDVNFTKGTATIAQTVILDKANKGAAMFGTPKTDGSARTIRLTNRTLEALKAHKKAQNETRLQSESWTSHDLVICTRDGNPIAPANCQRSFERIIRTAEIQKIRLHDLRHTAATVSLAAGVPVKVVSERLGHKSIVITLDTYAHVLKEMDESAAKAMDAAIAGALPQPEPEAAKIVQLG